VYSKYKGNVKDVVNQAIATATQGHFVQQGMKPRNDQWSKKQCRTENGRSNCKHCDKPHALNHKRELPPNQARDPSPVASKVNDKEIV